MLVIVWSFVAIAVEHADVPAVVVTASVASIIALILAISAFINGRRIWLPSVA